VALTLSMHDSLPALGRHVLSDPVRLSQMCACCAAFIFRFSRLLSWPAVADLVWCAVAGAVGRSLINLISNAAKVRSHALHAA
jgi:hypothetical protein